MLDNNGTSHLNMKRQQYKVKDQLIYEWEQNLNEIDIYIKPPDFVLSWYHDKLKEQYGPNVECAKLEVIIANNKVSVGVKGNPPYINE